MWPASGASRPDELPQPGYTAQEIMNAIHAGEIKALFSICFNPLVSLPDANFTREALEKLEFFGVIDFFLSETARSRRCGAGRQSAGRGGRRHLQRGGPRDPHSKGRRSAWQMPDAIRRSSAIWRAGWARASSFRFETPREIFEELREASRGGMPITTASPTRRSTRRWASSGPAPRSIIPARRI